MSLCFGDLEVFPSPVLKIFNVYRFSDHISKPKLIYQDHIKTSPPEKKKTPHTFYHVFFPRATNSGPEEFALNPAHKDLIAEDRDTCCLPLCKHYTCLGPLRLKAPSRKRSNRNLLFCVGSFCRSHVVFWYGMVSECWVEWGLYNHTVSG